MAEYVMFRRSTAFGLTEEDWQNPACPALADTPCIIEMSFPAGREMAHVQHFVFNLVVPWIQDPAQGLDGTFVIGMHHTNSAKGWRAILRFSDHRTAMMVKVRWC